MKKSIFRILIFALAIPSVCCAHTLEDMEKTTCENPTGEGLPFTINYYSGNSKIGSMDVSYITDGKNQFSIPETGTPTKQFTGWYTESTFKNKVFAVWQVPVTIERDDNGCPVSIHNVNIYAKIQQLYGSNGTGACNAVTGAGIDVTYKFGDGREDLTQRWLTGMAPGYNQILTPTREGYIFDGWYLDQSYLYSYNDLGVPIYSNPYYCKTDEPSLEDVTLYAKWTSEIEVFEKIFDNLMFSDLNKAKEERTNNGGEYSSTVLNGDTLTLNLVSKQKDGSLYKLSVPFKQNGGKITYTDNKDASTEDRVQGTASNIYLIYAALVKGGMSEEEALKAIFLYDFSKATYAKNGIEVIYGDTVNYESDGQTTQVTLINSLSVRGAGAYITDLPKSQISGLLEDISGIIDLPVDLLSEQDYGTTENPKTGVYDYVIYAIIIMPVGYTIIKYINKHKKFRNLN